MPAKEGSDIGMLSIAITAKPQCAIKYRTRRARDAGPEVQQHFHEKGHVLFRQDLVDRGDGDEQCDPIGNKAFHDLRERPHARQERDHGARDERQDNADKV